MNYGYAPFYMPQGFGGQNYAQPITQPSSPPPSQAESTMLWVLNKNEADSYPVAPNNSVVLWDKNSPTIYVKSMNSNGVPSMRTLDFVERTDNVPMGVNNLADKFVLLDDFRALRAELEEVKVRCERLASAEKTKEINKKTKGGE